MGDHRASIKIEFSMYGETKKADMWINWSGSSSECSDVDQRVIDFFRESHTAMYAKFMEAEWREVRKREARETEERERKELERLKAKYEGEQA
jgi:hypothetical protein